LLVLTDNADIRAIRHQGKQTSGQADIRAIRHQGNQTSGQSAVLILSIVILLQLHILNDIYLNCFNIKERKEARVRGMVIEWTHLMGNKSSRKV
jgi:hypothetical protein